MGSRARAHPPACQCGAPLSGGGCPVSAVSQRARAGEPWRSCHASDVGLRGALCSSCADERTCRVPPGRAGTWCSNSLRGCERPLSPWGSRNCGPEEGLGWRAREDLRAGPLQGALVRCLV
eukprot:1625683-Rhodomonas_salina.2